MIIKIICQNHIKPLSHVNLFSDVQTLQYRKTGKIIGGNFISQSLIFTSPSIKHNIYEMIGPDGADAYEHVNTTKDIKIHQDIKIRDINTLYEDIYQVYDRVSMFIDIFNILMNKHKKYRAIIFSHAIPIKCFIIKWFNLDIEDINNIVDPLDTDIITIANKVAIKKPQIEILNWAINGLHFAGKKHENRL